MRDIAARRLAVAARKELAKWEGQWEEIRGTTFFIKGDRWSWGMKGAEPVYHNTIRIVEIQEKMIQADLQVGDENGPMTDRVCKAIFRFEGDTLHYCGTYDLPRPTAFFKGMGDPYYVEWKRVKKSVPAR